MSLPSNAFDPQTFPLVQTGFDFITRLGEVCILTNLGQDTFDSNTQTVVTTKTLVNTKGFRSQPSNFESQETPFVGKHTEVVFLMPDTSPKPGDILSFNDVDLTIKRIRPMRYAQGIVAYRILAVQQ